MEVIRRPWLSEILYGVAFLNGGLYARMDDKFLDRIADELSLDNLLSLEERDALPEQEEDGEKNSGRDGEGTSKSKSQKSNAERLRKHRQKKKLERVEMYEENKVLKGERQEYLRKIADLELEVESLRGQGVMDLSRENELLRAEIKVVCYLALVSMDEQVSGVWLYRSTRSILNGW